MSFGKLFVTLRAKTTDMEENIMFKLADKTNRLIQDSIGLNKKQQRFTALIDQKDRRSARFTLKSTRDLIIPRGSVYLGTGRVLEILTVRRGLKKM